MMYVHQDDAVIVKTSSLNLKRNLIVFSDTNKTLTYYIHLPKTIKTEHILQSSPVLTRLYFTMYI